MKSSDPFEHLLKDALAPSIEPSEQLNQQILLKSKENPNMKHACRKMLSAAVLTAALTLTLSVSAFAAWKYLTPHQVANKLGNQAIARAFQQPNATILNQIQESGDYRIALLGLTSGKGLKSFTASDSDIHADRTYAVVSIERKDHTPMPDSQSEDYGKPPFFVSPLMQGQKPWQVNIATMNGGYAEFVLDGVLYRMIDCDTLEQFADRHLYLCVSSSSFYDNTAFSYNEKTGTITANPDYEGVNALFDLPLDPSKADPAKAQAYLKNLLSADSQTEDAANSDGSSKSDTPDRTTEWEAQAKQADKIKGSEQILKPNKKGVATYTSENGFQTTIELSSIFPNNQPGTVLLNQMKDGNGTVLFFQVTLDKDGTATGWMSQLQTS